MSARTESAAAPAGTADSIQTTDSGRVAPGGWYALVIMLLIFSCNFLDRSALALVAEPVRKEFGLSDSQLGVLNGFAFGLMFALAGIPIGVLVDRVNRRKLLSSVVFFWSTATALCALAQNYVGLVIGRMAVGAAEAGGAPTSYSLMSDFFPPRLRSTAVGFYYLGGAVGGLLCYLVGSRVAAQYGWRAALVVAAVPGIALGILAFATLREPARGATDPGARPTSGEPPVGLIQAWRQIASNRALLALFGAAPLISASASAMGAWLPPYFMRSHGMSIGAASLILGIAGGGCGALGSTLGGSLADRLSRNSATGRTAFGACALVLSVPALLIASLAVGNAAAISMSFLSFVLMFAGLPVAFGGMLTLTSPRIRGIASASMQGVTNLLGYGLGPLAVGILSDAFGGPNSLRYALAGVTSVCCLGAVVCFLLARAAIRSGHNVTAPLTEARRA